MEIPEQGAVNPVNLCEWCLAVGTSRCGRCHSSYYCCRQHQIEHWAIHKKVCKKTKAPSLTVQAPVMLNAPDDIVTSADNFTSYSGWCQNNLQGDNKNEAVGTTIVPTAVLESSVCIQDVEKVDYQTPPEDEVFSSLSSELLSSDNNFWDIINSCDAQSLLDYGAYLEKDGTLGEVAKTFLESSSLPSGSELSDNSEASTEESNTAIIQCASLQDICTNVVHDLNTYGMCVLDKFIGSKQGGMLLDEVKNLYRKGIFKKGEIVNRNPYVSRENIRSDVTTWVDGSEPDCSCIGSLIKKLDVVVTTCNKLSNNGILSQYKLHRRTKAMIACYPGDGTYYKKHIDNPHGDGRVITCIYYLNQNWDVKQHGGLLRLFPSAQDSQIANIEPIFDRMLFFWSDKRNPHEVLPSFAPRFAITVWYFDADERDRALMKSGKVLNVKRQSQGNRR